MQRKPGKPDRNTDISCDRADRLSGLMARFPMRVGDGAGRLLLRADTNGDPVCAEFWPRGGGGDDAELAVHVDWGGPDNPMLAALPETVRLCASRDPEATALMAMLISEAAARRCGAESVLARLSEVLMIRMLRAEIGGGRSGTPSLLCGLTHPQISRAIAAMHDAPGRGWRNADLAGIAGLSLSRFAELFLKTVGETPMAYLRRWRLILARRELAAGERVKAVARRLGYASPEALSRAFQAAYGVSPRTLRRAA